MLLDGLPLLKHGGKQISLWLKNISLWIYVAHSFIHSLVGRPLDNLSVLDDSLPPISSGLTVVCGFADLFQ